MPKRLALFTVIAILLAGCTPPPVQMGFEMTEDSICVTVEPDSLAVGPASIEVEGSRIRICYPLDPQ